MNTNDDKRFAAFTVCNLAYLPKALVLAESLFKFDKNRLVIYLIDKKCDFDVSTLSPNIIWIEDCDIPDFKYLAFKYDITELSTSLKPLLALRLLQAYTKVIFLDPDICLYQTVDPILVDLDDSNVLLTPHYTVPHANTLPDSDLGMMKFGSFNLGFFAVSDSPQAVSFLQWWSDRCLRMCFFEPQFGLSTDQKWVSIAPCFFEKLGISFNLGYNVAFWNLQERILSTTDGENYLINNTFPLVFFHFSSFDEQNPQQLSKRAFPGQNENRTDYLKISEEYKQALLRQKPLVPSAKYGFDYMSAGDYISPTLRRAYSSVAHELPPAHDPFDSNGPVHAFSKKNHLFEKNIGTFQSNSYGDMAKHSRKFSVLYFMMRILLRSMGPNRFANFSRLLVYLSSYRQTRGLWKI